MQNVKVTIAYDGSRYHGFQRQENAIAIQQIIEDTLETVFRKKVIIYGCSRTDTGVHANEYCFNFRHDTSITPSGIVKTLNALLPDDIGVLKAENVDDEFHARYDCVAKEYKYIISNTLIKNPFLKDRALRYGIKIDEEKLNKIAQDFVGEYDFRSFCSIKTTAQDTVRKIEKISVTREGDLVIITVLGNGFLYNMVRIMVGTLLFINENKIGEDKIKEIIASCDRERAGKTAKADGLYLNRVYY